MHSNSDGSQISREELQRRYEELQLRVTRFSAVEQQLVNVRHRLDSETAVFNRLHRFNTAAFKDMPWSEFAALIAESVVDIFEVEFGIFWDCGMAGGRGDDCNCSVHGIQLCPEQAVSLFQQILPRLPTEQVVLLGPEHLAQFHCLPPLHQAFVIVFVQGENKPMIALMAGITKGGAKLYDALKPDRGGAFAVFSQQVVAHCLNQRGRRTIQEHAESVRRSEEQLGLALRGANLGWWDWNIATGHVTFNEQWAGMLGYRVAELSPNYETWRDLLHPDDCVVVLEKLHQHMAGEQAQFEAEVRMRTKQGDWKWVLTRGRVVDRDDAGKPQRASGTHLDITERKRVEAALQDSERRYRMLVTNMREVAFQTDGDGKWMMLNEAWTEITGFPVNECLGKSFLEFVYPDDRELNIKRFEPLVARQKDYCHHETRYRTQSGGVKWIEVHARLTLDEAGRPTGTVGTLRDITARREAQAHLAEALSREKELSRLRNGFITMASHEFRTPLAGIMHAAELLRDFRKEMTDAEHERYYQLILDGTKRIDGLIEDVLVLGRAQSGKMNYDPEDIDLAPLLRHWIAELPVPELDRKRIRFANHRTSGSVPIDSELLRHVLMNLLTNALKYSAEDSPVDLILHQDQDGTSRLQVCDKGIGVPANELGEIFQPFQRGSNVGKIKGSGVGLATVKSCLDLMGARIQVQSEVGKGTCFDLFLPLTPEKE